MVSAHWTAAVMTPVMVGRYRGTVRKRGYAAADFYSAEPTNEAFIPGKLSFLDDGNSGGANTITHVNNMI